VTVAASLNAPSDAQSGSGRCFGLGPLFLRKRTSANAPRQLSAKSDYEESQQKSQLLDHLVGTGEERRRYVNAKSLRCLEVDHQFVLSRRLHGQV